jgi:hypothetical protein
MIQKKRKINSFSSSSTFAKHFIQYSVGYLHIGWSVSCGSNFRSGYHCPCPKGEVLTVSEAGHPAGTGSLGSLIFAGRDGLVTTPALLPPATFFAWALALLFTVLGLLLLLQLLLWLLL